MSFPKVLEKELWMYSYYLLSGHSAFMEEIMKSQLWWQHMYSSSKAKGTYTLYQTAVCFIVIYKELARHD